MKHKLLTLLILFTFLSVHGFSGGNDGPTPEKKKITVEDIWKFYKFYPSSPEEFNWMKDDQFYSVQEETEIAQYSIKTGEKVSTILKTDDLRDPQTDSLLEVSTYSFSPDEKKILLKTSVTPVFRHSTLDVCYVYDRDSKKLHKIHSGKQVMFPDFSADGSKLGYLFENNVFYDDLGSGTITQVTTDGKRNQIINGGTDWVNEEEFAFTQAWFFSPDGQKIAYYKFDEGLVPEFSYEKYSGLYPQVETFKYPKAGEANAKVNLFMYDLKTRTTTDVKLGNDPEHYIPRIKWTINPNELAVMEMNRLQNKVDIWIINSATGSGKIVYTESSNTYLTEVTDKSWLFLDNGEEFLWQSEKDGNNHLYLVPLDGTPMKQVTKGEWEVTDIAGVDQKAGLIYFVSTEVSPVEKHLYSISFEGKGKKKLSNFEGTHNVSMSSAFNYYMDSYSSFMGVPQAGLFDKSGKEIKKLEENEKLKNTLAEYDLATPKFMEIKTESAGLLNAWVIKPPDFDAKKKYPLLMFVYGGPGSQTVKNEFGGFNYFWYQMLAQNGYIVASVDGRGTGGRGAEFKKCTYADLGNLEIQDQISAAKWFGGQSWVDASRIGIWGWSYGGYMTLLGLTKGEGIFKMGISVAPVTNWRFYDTIYTERYLKTPQLNPDGYDKNSPITFANKLQGKLLLVHGTGDDNVHAQNSYEMINAFIKGNQTFDSEFYPNRNHGIYGGPTRLHLYNRMTEFIYHNL